MKNTQFDGFPDNYQYRNHLCKEYFRLLTNSELRLLILESRQGIGATSFSAEYYQSLVDPAILLIVNPSCRAGYSINFILNQAIEQGYEVLKISNNTNISNLSTSELTKEWEKTLNKLRKFVKSSQKKLHIIIDGLYQIPPEDDRHVQDIIMSALALGFNDVCHVVTWNENKPIHKNLKNINHRIIPIPTLSETESKQLLSSKGIDSNHLQHVIDACSGIPELLNQIIRLKEINKVDYHNLHSALSAPYRIEWEYLKDRYSQLPCSIEKLFAYTVYAKKQLDTDNISLISKIDQSLIKTIFDESRFVKVGNDNKVVFISNSKREFLKNELQSYRKDVLNDFVDSLLTNPNSDDSINLLPNYYEEMGRHEDILSVLTPENLDIYLSNTQSLTSLRRRSELGLEASEKVKHLIETYRFGLQTSIIRTLESSNSDDALLDAYTSIDRLEDALSLAQNQQTKESKLLLLSKYANFLFKRGMHLDDVLSEDIQNLIKDIDLIDDKERSILIAENLVGPFPEIGIAIVEKCSNGANDFQDIVFTHLALKSNSDNPDSFSTSEKYTSKIKDSRLQGFLTASQAVTNGKSANDVIDSTALLDGRQRSFLLKGWIVGHPNDKHILDVVDFALDEVARDAAYLPSASDLTVFCNAVVKSEISGKSTSILNRVQAQRLSLLDLSPSVDKFRLDYEIAKAKSKLKLDNPNDLLTNLYVIVSDFSVETTKLECFSWLYSGLNKFPNISVEIKDEFTSLCIEGLRDAFSKSLLNSAEHSEVIQCVINGLIDVNPELLIEFIKCLNTQTRRDNAYLSFTDRYLQLKQDRPLKINLLLTAINQIIDCQTKNEAIITSLRLLEKHSPNLDIPPKEIIAMGESLSDPLGVAYAYISIIGISKKYLLPISLEDISIKFSSICSQIDQVWRIPELNYLVISSYAQIDKIFAIEQMEKFKTSHVASYTNSTYSNLLSQLARLTTVSFTGLLYCRTDVESELDSLFEIIELIQSTVLKIDIYTDLSLRAYSCGKIEIFNKIVEEKILTILTNYTGSDYVKKKIFQYSFPSVFINNKAYAETLISAFNEKWDESYRQLIEFYLTKVPISEPYADQYYGNCKLTYPDAISVVDLIERINEDSVLASSIEAFCFAATTAKSKSNLTKHQRVSISERLIKKTISTLPDRNNISHDGWIIYIKTMLNVLTDEENIQNWETLIKSASSIPNISDSIFVLSRIAKCLPKKHSSQKKDLFLKIEAALSKIPSIHDRVSRAIYLSDAVLSVDTEKLIAKRLLTKAMTETLEVKLSEDVSEIQRNIIDSAYQIDKDFAQELLMLIDDDPARIRAKSELRDHLNLKNNKNAIINRNSSICEKDIENVGKIGWEMLGSLNCEKVPPLKQDEISVYIKSAHKRDLPESFGFYWWYLKALQEKYKDKQHQSEAILVPLFEVTSLTSSLVDKISRRVSGKLLQTININYNNDTTSFIAVPGDRDDALRFIKTWLDETNDTDVIICDPYFRPENINFIKELSFYKDGLNFHILSCINSSQSLSSDIRSEYQKNWSLIAHVKPPSLRSINVTYDGDKGKNPIHDRWLICGDKALRFGTSFSSFGESKVSEISKVNSTDLQSIKSVITPFLNMTERWLDGKRLKYEMFEI